MKKYLLISIISIVILSGMLGYLKVFGYDGNCTNYINGVIDVPCYVYNIYNQNQKIIYLEQQDITLRAYQFCDVTTDDIFFHKYINNFPETDSTVLHYDCVSQVLNDTK